MRGQRVRRLPWLVVGGLVFAALLLATFLAPEQVAVPDYARRFLGPFEAPPMGTDDRGIPFPIRTSRRRNRDVTSCGGWVRGHVDVGDSRAHSM